uniref:Transcriptional modulator of MazE/toxin, MazF n=1 Tax=Geobacter sp. (strain M21) TaxID=443144 RepID=C6E4I2_GEOSM
MRRGNVVLVATPGDYGKPRPALIIQTSMFSEHPSVTVCLVTSHKLDAPLFRYQVEPHADNGLAVTSWVQTDKIMTLPRQKIGTVIGHLSEKQISEVTKLLAFWIGIAD